MEFLYTANLSTGKVSISQEPAIGFEACENQGIFLRIGRSVSFQQDCLACSADGVATSLPTHVRGVQSSITQPLLWASTG